MDGRGWDWRVCNAVDVVVDDGGGGGDDSSEGWVSCVLMMLASVMDVCCCWCCCVWRIMLDFVGSDGFVVVVVDDESGIGRGGGRIGMSGCVGMVVSGAVVLP